MSLCEAARKYSVHVETLHRRTAGLGVLIAVLVHLPTVLTSEATLTLCRPQALSYETISLPSLVQSMGG